MRLLPRMELHVETILWLELDWNNQRKLCLGVGIHRCILGGFPQLDYMWESGCEHTLS